MNSISTNDPVSPGPWRPVNRDVPHVRQRVLSPKSYQMECLHCRQLQWTDRESFAHVLWRLDFYWEHKRCSPGGKR